MESGLRSVAELPACLQPVYASSFRYFNSIQSDCFNALMHSDVSMVVAAPTGAGKTVLLELAILRLLSRYVAPSGHFQHQKGAYKAIYLAPAKALVQEKTTEWRSRFGQTLGLVVEEVTGDTDHEDLSRMDSADIICTTPEKFDAMTRRNHDRGGMRFFNEISVVLIDEVHLLSEDRGSCLEAGVVSRIKLVSTKPELSGTPIASVRFLAVSATVPNAEDLAQWLGAPPAAVRVYGDEMRPVRLATSVRAYPKSCNDFLFEKRLNDHVWGVLNDNSRGRPALVFCASRNGAAATAERVAREATRAAAGSRPSALLRDPAHHQRLLAAAASLTDTKLRELLALGVGYHHGAMEATERTAVETAFRSGDLPVLCTTSTLAVGVNLPAFLVVVKGTRRYAGAEAGGGGGGGYEDYDRSTVLQMVGRAGRPQFDTEGVAVIMTDRDSARRYTQLLGAAEPVESTLRKALPEYLNAEIALGTITDVATALAWLKSTYFYVRVRKDPTKYGVPQKIRSSGIAGLENWLCEELVDKTVQELAAHGMVQLCPSFQGNDSGKGGRLEPLRPGSIMAEQYVRVATMVGVVGCPRGGGIKDLLWIIARSAELEGIVLRRAEKKALNAANKSDALRHHVMSTAKPDRIADRISTAADKVFVLINHALADDCPEKLDYSLRQDAERAVATGARLAGAMAKFFIHEERAAEAFNSLMLKKSLEQRVWAGSKTETRQAPGVGAVLSERLAAAGVRSLKEMMAVDPRRLESLAQKAFPWGSKVQDELRRVMPPGLTLTCDPVGWAPGGCVELEVVLTREEGGSGGGGGGGRRRCPGRLLVGTLHDNALLACRSLCLDTFESPLRLRLKTKTSAGRAAVEVVASVVHATLVGADIAIKSEVPEGAQLDGTVPAPLPAVAAPPPALAEAPPPASTHIGGDDTTVSLPLQDQNEKPKPQKTAVKSKVVRKTGAAKPTGDAGAKDFLQRKLHELKGLQPGAVNVAVNSAQLGATAAAPLQAQGPQSVTAALQPSAVTHHAPVIPKWTPFAASQGPQQQVQRPAAPAPPASSAWRVPAAPKAPAPQQRVQPLQTASQLPVPVQQPQPQHQRPQPAGPAGIASTFGRFAFTGGAGGVGGTNSAAPNAPAAVEVASRSGGRPGQPRAASGGRGGAPAAPVPAPKRVKMAAPSLNWLSAKFQAGAAKAGQPSAQQGAVAATAVAPSTATDVDVSKALDFL